MNPFYFGQAPRSLFGVYHPPRSERSRDAGVVLCYPFGQEYMRAHRAFRQLALLLSGAGFHVLRFDYSGTGDSSGDAMAFGLHDWVEDTRAAMDELRDTADVERIAVVGLRLGGAIAALAAAERDDVSPVVLWDPVVQGAAYLEEIAEADRSPGAGRLAAEGTVGVMGFPITRRLHADIAALDLCTVGTAAGSARYLVHSERAARYDALAAASAASGTSRADHVPGNGNWNEVDDYGGALIPVALIQAIVRYLSEEVQ